MFRTFPRFLSVALAVSLMAAACGEDTSEEVVETTATTTTTTQPPPTQEEPEASETEEAPEPSGTIVEVAVASGAFPTVNGADITITINGDAVAVNNATVVTTDIQATNGIIHVIDTVLLPPSEG